jgi:AmmeMemoRadiSam system protein A
MMTGNSSVEMDRLTAEEKTTLLGLARTTIELAVNEQPGLELDLESYPARLQRQGASFVTLTNAGELRGCIGALEAYQPLVQDVCEHAAAAAQEDYRFPPVQPDEVAELNIEISHLTQPESLEYATPDELVSKLRPGVDGVILRDGMHRATFLPQVWEKLPEPEEFLAHLCMKMGAPANYWRRKKLVVQIYQVEEFSEGKPQE